MKFNIRTEQTEAGVVTVVPVGTIDSQTSENLDKEIERALGEPVKTLVLDMAGVKFISSAGIGAIIKAKASMNRKGGDLAMINVQAQVKKAFEILRLLPSLNVFEDRNDLDKYLSRVQRRMLGEDD